MAALVQGCTSKLTPCRPQPQGAGVQGVSNGKVMIVGHTHVGPEINFFPLGSPNKFWGARFLVWGWSTPQGDWMKAKLQNDACSKL